jgi:hypothetical protein
MAQLFTADDAWLGGLYELAMEIGARSDDRLRAALVALWDHPALTGCYLQRDREPSAQSRLSAAEAPIEGGTHHLLGIALLPNGSRVACGSCIIREDAGPDWLDFYLSMGALSAAYPIAAFPFDEERNPPGPWRREIEDWLAQIGLWVSGLASCRLGLVGLEVSGMTYAEKVAVDGIPAKRYVAYLWPSTSGMVYHPRSV